MLHADRDKREEKHNKRKQNKLVQRAINHNDKLDNEIEEEEENT